MTTRYTDLANLKDLTQDDYKEILRYYDIEIPRYPALIKRAAESALSDKLCKCIMKMRRMPFIRRTDDGRAPELKYCKQQIITRRGLHIHGFKCRGGAELSTKKGRRITRSSIKLQKSADDFTMHPGLRTVRTSWWHRERERERERRRRRGRSESVVPARRRSERLLSRRQRTLRRSERLRKK